MSKVWFEVDPKFVNLKCLCGSTQTCPAADRDDGVICYPSKDGWNGGRESCQHLDYDIEKD